MAGEYPSDTPSRRRSTRRARGRRTYADTGSDGRGVGDRRSGGTGSGGAEFDDSRSPGGDGPESGGVQARQADDPEARARLAGAARVAGAAQEICLRLLTLAPRTRAQLADALKKRGVPEEVADDVLGRFTDAGLIDDAAFARAWVESRHHGRGLSGRALAAELRQRGVDDDQICEAVDELGPDAEVETARQLVARRLAATQGEPAQARTRRLAGMLARKGYPPGLAFRVIREALEAEGADAAALIGDVPFDEEPPDD